MAASVVTAATATARRFALAARDRNHPRAPREDPLPLWVERLSMLHASEGREVMRTSSEPLLIRGGMTGSTYHAFHAFQETSTNYLDEIFSRRGKLRVVAAGRIVCNFE
jgi:hypothetical protein